MPDTMVMEAKEILGLYDRELSRGYDYCYKLPDYVSSFISDSKLPDDFYIKPQTIDRSVTVFDGLDRIVARISYASIRAGFGVSIYLGTDNG